MNLITPALRTGRDCSNRSHDRNVAADSFPKAVKILESGVLNLRPLITHTLALDKTREAIEILRRGEGIEILIDLKI